MVQLSHPYMTTGKTIALTRWTFVDKLMSLLLNMLSMLNMLTFGKGKQYSLPHWMARKSNQSIVKEISPEYSLEGLMLKLKLQFFGHLIQRADSLQKTLMLGNIEGRKGRG